MLPGSFGPGNRCKHASQSHISAREEAGTIRNIFANLQMELSSACISVFFFIVNHLYEIIVIPFAQDIGQHYD